MVHRRSSVGAFALSPKRRRSILGPAPSRTSPMDSPMVQTGVHHGGSPAEGVFAQLPQVDDVKEKRLNKLNRLQQMNFSSPNGTASSDHRNSLGGVVHSLTNQQLIDHNSKCIQLSTENKINTKNAFNLQLIDYMTEMLTRKDNDLKNFQMASLTLDASTKIYACRVDRIHSDTLKMAGGLGRTQDQPEGQLDANQKEDSGGSGLPKKRMKKKATIEKNLKNINMGHVSIDYDIDPLFKKHSASVDDGGRSMFINCLHILDDSCQLNLDSTTVMPPTTFKSNVTDTPLCSIPAIPDLSNKLTCPTFSTFTFSNWRVSDEQDDISKIINEDEPQKDDQFAFDINAVPEPIVDDAFEAFGIEDDLMGDDDTAITNNATVMTVGGGGCHARPPPLMETVHLKEHLANTPLEYSYFDSRVMSAWAGPGHWRLKPMSKEPNKPGGVTKEERKKKQNVILNYADSEDTSKLFDVTKRATKLSYNTVKHWDKEKTTLPFDLHYNSAEFCKPHWRPAIVVRKQLGTNNNSKSCDDINEYDYDNKNDMENYCPDVDDAGSNYDDTKQGSFCDMTNVFDSQPNANDMTRMNEFTGENLVIAPNKVAKINIMYAQRAKKMDMKKLKFSMWDMLLDSPDDKENDKRIENQMPGILPDSERDMNNIASGKNFQFSNIYSDLKVRLPTQMSENLSMPLAFIALLHLSNEHNLRLVQQEELGDFIIEQD